MSAALKRSDDLKTKFRDAVPSRRLKASQWRAITEAAAIQQVIEIAIAGMVMGCPHDRAQIVSLQNRVRHLLAEAGANVKHGKVLTNVV
jgi:hypothetical protein